jgi:hypothetical protein
MMYALLHIRTIVLMYPIAYHVTCHSEGPAHGIREGFIAIALFGDDLFRSCWHEFDRKTQLTNIRLHKIFSLTRLSERCAAISGPNSDHGSYD